MSNHLDRAQKTAPCPSTSSMGGYVLDAEVSMANSLLSIAQSLEKMTAESKTSDTMVGPRINNDWDASRAVHAAVRGDVSGFPSDYNTTVRENLYQGAALALLRELLHEPLNLDKLELIMGRARRLIDEHDAVKDPHGQDQGSREGTQAE